MRLQAEIERRVHAARPALRHLDGDELLADAMARLAHDAWQRAPHEEVSMLGRDDDGPADEQALKFLRFLLGALERVAVEEFYIGEDVQDPDVNEPELVSAREMAEACGPASPPRAAAHAGSAIRSRRPS